MEEMEQKFGKFTLDELKNACSICLDNSKKCSDGCPLATGGPSDCRVDMVTSVLELIKAYETIRPLCTHWFKRADALSDKATKYDSVRNELIRTQELLKNSQDECRKRADKIKYLRETIDTKDDEYNELDAKLKNEEMARKSLEIDIKNLKDDLGNFKRERDDLQIERAKLLYKLRGYSELWGALQTIKEVMHIDRSGDHEKD